MKKGLGILVFTILTAGCINKNPTVTTHLQAANYMNPDIYHHSAPVVVTIYQLKSPTAFQQANFFALNNNAVGVLGGDLLDKQEVELRPKQAQTIKIMLLPATNYIGVVAAFRDPDRSQWRQVVKVQANKSAKLQVNLGTQNVMAKIK